MTRARDLAAGTFELATGGVLKLETSDTTVTDGSVLGKIEFKAPDEASGTDAILVGAAIEAVAEGTFAADNNATELVFKTGASAAADAKMTLTSGGNLGIGTSSPSAVFHSVSSGSSDTGIFERGDASGTSRITIKSGDGSYGTINAPDGGNILAFFIGANEATRIDASGNLLVGHTSAFSPISNSGSGVTATASGQLLAGHAGPPLYVNREDSDGDIAVFRKDGTAVGSIGTNGGRVYTAGPSRGIKFGNVSADPCTNTGATADNSYDLGGSSVRWKDLYISGGVYLGGVGSSNKLDDYEEGTWTPTGSSITFAEQVGLYVKIGNVVHVGARVTFPTTSDSGDAKITGLPFTSTNSNAARAGITVSWHDEGSSNGLAFLVTNNSTEGLFYLGASSKTNANMSGHTAYIGGTYLSG